MSSRGGSIRGENSTHRPLAFLRGARLRVVELRQAAQRPLQGLPARAVIHSGQLSAARFRNRVRADNRRQHQRAAWARLFEDVDVVLAPVLPTARVSP